MEFDRSGKPNALRDGSGSVRLFIIKRHEESPMHKDAESAKRIKDSRPMESSLLRMAEHDREQMRRLFKIAYYLAARARPFKDFPGLIELYRDMGYDMSDTYATDKKAREFTQYIYEDLKRQYVKSVRGSQYPYFSVASDASTDAGVREQELVYGRVLVNGRPKTSFLGLRRLCLRQSSMS
jgi:hypothetical protein